MFFFLQIGQSKRECVIELNWSILQVKQKYFHTEISQGFFSSHLVVCFVKIGQNSFKKLIFGEYMVLLSTK